MMNADFVNEYSIRIGGMKMLRTVQQLVLGLGGAIVAMASTGDMAQAGSFTGTYQFDGDSLVAVMDGVDAPVFSRFEYQKTDSQNGTGNPDFSDGSKAGAVGASDRGYQADRWNGNTANDLRNFFQFGLTPQSGQQVSLTRLLFNHRRRTESGPSIWELRSSLDGYGAAIANGAIAIGSDTASWVSSPYLGTIDFADRFANLTDAITFRLYAYGSSQWNSLWLVDNVQLEGGTSLVNPQVSGFGANAAAPVPTPAILPALVSFSFGLWRKRRVAGD
jgi:hypothetical protein